MSVHAYSANNKGNNKNTALPILLFHTLEPGKAGICFPPQTFARGLELLHRKGFHTIPLSVAAGYIRRGETFPPRTFVITFDDAFETVYTQAFPVLQRFKMTATVFITTGQQDEPPRLQGRATLSWKQIREMSAAGIAFGAHTLTHPNLTQLDAISAEHEIRTSKEIIQDHIGTHVTSFAYPDGRYNTTIRALAAEHFHDACVAQLGLVKPQSDCYTLERVDGFFLRDTFGFQLLAYGWLGIYLNTRNRVRGSWRTAAA